MSAPARGRGLRLAAVLTLALLAGGAAAQPLAPLAPAGAAAPDEANKLGRLFFTPERRQELDRRRQFPLRQASAPDSTKDYRIDGVVTRSSGQRTVWINGVTQDDDTHTSGVAVSTSRSQPGRVVVHPAAAPVTRAPVGATVEGASGKTTDLLGSGRITTHPVGTR